MYIEVEDGEYKIILNEGDKKQLQKIFSAGKNFFHHVKMHNKDFKYRGITRCEGDENNQITIYFSILPMEGISSITNSWLSIESFLRSFLSLDELSQLS